MKPCVNLLDILTTAKLQITSNAPITYNVFKIAMPPVLCGYGNMVIDSNGDFPVFKQRTGWDPWVYTVFYII